MRKAGARHDKLGHQRTHVGANAPGVDGVLVPVSDPLEGCVFEEDIPPPARRHEADADSPHFRSTGVLAGWPVSEHAGDKIHANRVPRV